MSGSDFIVYCYREFNCIIQLYSLVGINIGLYNVRGGSQSNAAKASRVRVTILQHSAEFHLRHGL